jgi:SAM-dependent methyltransferase
MLDWKDGERFVVGGTAFQALLTGTVKYGEPEREEEFLIFKPRPLIERYATLVAELRPQRIFELGIKTGGSTMFFAEFARPLRLVAIDREPLSQVIERIQAQAAQADLAEVVRAFGDVDQADRARLAEIVEEQFDGSPLDLVVDDCSHLYEPTRASFNELFPRLGPNGVYVIEDWQWAHPPLDSEDPERVLYPGQVPLTRLLFEIALALPSIPGLISNISISSPAAVITRGDADIDPSGFDISTCSNRKGQALLAR